MSWVIPDINGGGGGWKKKIASIHSVVGKIKDMVSNDESSQNEDDFSINIVPNNFVAALPQWGPYFAISFFVEFFELPSNDQEVKQVMQFFTADERFKGSTLGKFIPAISVVNIHNNVNLVVTMQFTDNDDDTKQFVFPNIVTGKKYQVHITQLSENDQTMFSVKVSGHGTQSAPFNSAPIIYNTLGIFVCNSNFGDNANGTVSFLTYNNIQAEIEIKPSIYGVAPSWTKEYLMSVTASLKNLPDQSGELSNLINLVGTPPATDEISDSFASLYNVSREGRAEIEDSILPNLNILRDSNDDSFYWCFMLKYSSSQTLPKTHDECDLTSDENNAPLVNKDHAIHFMQTEGKVSATVNGESLFNSVTGQAFANADPSFSSTLKNVKIAVGSNLRTSTRKLQANRGFFDVFNKVTVAVGSFATMAIEDVDTAASILGG